MNLYRSFHFRIGRVLQVAGTRTPDFREAGGVETGVLVFIDRELSGQSSRAADTARAFI